MGVSVEPVVTFTVPMARALKGYRTSCDPQSPRGWRRLGPVTFEEVEVAAGGVAAITYTYRPSREQWPGATYLFERTTGVTTR